MQETYVFPSKVQLSWFHFIYKDEKSVIILCMVMRGVFPDINYALVHKTFMNMDHGCCVILQIYNIFFKLLL